MIHVKKKYQPPEIVTLEEANIRLARGEYFGDEEAWRPGMAEWKLLSHIEGVQLPSPPPAGSNPRAPITKFTEPPPQPAVNLTRIPSNLPKDIEPHLESLETPPRSKSWWNRAVLWGFGIAIVIGLLNQLAAQNPKYSALSHGDSLLDSILKPAMTMVFLVIVGSVVRWIYRLFSSKC